MLLLLNFPQDAPDSVKVHHEHLSHKHRQAVLRANDATNLYQKSPGMASVPYRRWCGTRGAICACHYGGPGLNPRLWYIGQQTPIESPPRESKKSLLEVAFWFGAVRVVVSRWSRLKVTHIARHHRQSGWKMLIVLQDAASSSSTISTTMFFSAGRAGEPHAGFPWMPHFQSAAVVHSARLLALESLARQRRHCATSVVFCCCFGPTGEGPGREKKEKNRTIQSWGFSRARFLFHVVPFSWGQVRSAGRMRFPWSPPHQRLWGCPSRHWVEPVSVRRSRYC